MLPFSPASSALQVRRPFPRSAFELDLKLMPNAILGSDMTMLKVGQETLEKAGWPTTVLTGRFMFDVGDNERNARSDSKL